MFCSLDSQDKPKSIAESYANSASLINVVKIGEAGRKFNVYKRGATKEDEDTLIWSNVIEPGDAIIMTLEANLQTKHEVPMGEGNEKIGDSGSIVFRSICDIVPYDEVQKKIKTSRMQKAAAKIKKAAEKIKKAAAEKKEADKKELEGECSELKEEADQHAKKKREEHEAAWTEHLQKKKQRQANEQREGKEEDEGRKRARLVSAALESGSDSSSD